MAYTGFEARITLGQMGLLTDVPPGDVPPGALIRATNVSFETGVLTKARGDIRYNLSALPSGVVALIDWRPNPVTQRTIAACRNGSIYRDIGDRLFTSNTAIASGLGPLTPRAMFVEGGSETPLRDRKLFFFSGYSQVRVLEGDGTTFTEIINPAADWVSPNFPAVGLVHKNRLWAFMKQRAYASTTGDHTDFEDSNNILTQNVFPGEGGDIVGAHVFKGRLFCFKEGGHVYYLEDSDIDSDNWSWRKLASNFGLCSPHAILEAINDMIGVNESGSPISYNATDALGEIESADILRILQIEDYFRSVTNSSGLSELHTLYYEAKKQALFTWRSSYRTTNDMIFCIDFNKENPRAALWTKNQANCLTLRQDNHKIKRPVYGSEDGFVYLMDREDRLVHQTGYTGEFKTGHTDFKWLDARIAEKNKIFDFLSVEFIPQGSWSLAIDVFIDGKFIETINFSMDVRDDGLDDFTLDPGSGTGMTTPGGGYGDPLGREETQTVRKPLHGSGRRISFHARGTGANQNFAVASLTVGFRASAEQATKV